MIREATAGLDGDDEGALWGLADDIARFLRTADPAEIDLLRELLAVLVRRAEKGQPVVPPRYDESAGPAWSQPFAADRRAALQRFGPFPVLDRGWAFGDGDGAGIVVAVVDSGVEGDHPAIGDALRDSVRIEFTDEGAIAVPDEAVDAVGHGTACAGIIHALAPKATILSVSRPRL